YGIVHGGVYCTIVETLASVAGAVWFGERGDVVGVANHTNFLRAVRGGTLHAVASPIHRGRSQQLWLVEIADDEGRAVARGELRLANLTSAGDLG
ncbi:MAG: PaaI family thioesterase, partial [Actinomycetota bacterium]|nr:PaaI family thioesterase [Actinomycetota bacterium]